MINPVMIGGPLQAVRSVTVIDRISIKINYNDEEVVHVYVSMPFIALYPTAIRSMNYQRTPIGKMHANYYRLE